MTGNAVREGGGLIPPGRRAGRWGRSVPVMGAAALVVAALLAATPAGAAAG